MLDFAHAFATLRYLSLLFHTIDAFSLMLRRYASFFDCFAAMTPFSIFRLLRAPSQLLVSLAVLCATMLPLLAPLYVITPALLLIAIRAPL